MSIILEDISPLWLWSHFLFIIFLVLIIIRELTIDRNNTHQNLIDSTSTIIVIRWILLSVITSFWSSFRSGCSFWSSVTTSQIPNCHKKGVADSFLHLLNFFYLCLIFCALNASDVIIFFPITASENAATN